MSKSSKRAQLPNPFIKFSLPHLLASDNPSLDLTIPSFDRRVAAFKGALSKYTSANQEEVLKRREAYVNLMQRLKNERIDCLKEKAEWELRGIEMGKQIEEERIERKAAEEAVAHNQRQIKSLQDKLDEINAELSRLEAGLEGLKKSKEKEKRQLQKQSSSVARDVIDLEKSLGVTMRGAGNDILKIVWTNLDAKDPEREFFIVLDLSKHEYTVPDLSPYLPNLSALVDTLNGDRDLFGFLRQVRKAFLQTLE